MRLKSFFRRSSDPVSRCRLPGGRRGSVRDPASQPCKPSKLDGTKLDGPRPPRAALDCLAAALRAEQVATNDLAAARDNVRDCLSAARRDGATYSSVVSARRIEEHDQGHAARALAHGERAGVAAPARRASVPGPLIGCRGRWLISSRCSSRQGREGAVDAATTV